MSDITDEQRQRMHHLNKVMTRREIVDAVKRAADHYDQYDLAMARAFKILAEELMR